MVKGKKPKSKDNSKYTTNKEVKAIIKAEFKPEPKFFVQNDLLTVSSAGVKQPYGNYISQGLTDKTRIGNIVNIQSIEYKLTVYNGGGSIYGTGPLRVIWYMEKQAERDRAITLLYPNTTTILSILEDRYKDEVHILSDKTYNVTSNAIGASTSLNKQNMNTFIKGFLKIPKSMKTKYTGTGGTVIENDIKLILIGEGLTVPAGAQTYNATVKVRYLDV